MGQQWGSIMGQQWGSNGALLTLNEPSGYGGSGSGAHSLHNFYFYSFFLCTRVRKRMNNGM